MKFRVEYECEILVKRAAELNLVSDRDIKQDIPNVGTVFIQTGATYDENT